MDFDGKKSATGARKPTPQKNVLPTLWGARIVPRLPFSSSPQRAKNRRQYDVVMEVRAYVIGLLE